MFSVTVDNNNSGVLVFKNKMNLFCDTLILG